MLLAGSPEKLCFQSHGPGGYTLILYVVMIWSQRITCVVIIFPKDSWSPLNIKHLVFLFVMHIYNFAAHDIKA